MNLNRRQFLYAGSLGALCLTRANAGEASLIRSIRRNMIWNGRKADVTWFHPRACTVPHQLNPQVLITCQSITGSDVFGQVHYSTTDDLGKTWTAPQAIEAFARHEIDDGFQMGVCDVVPEYHAKTQLVLAIGHNVYYKDGKLTRPGKQRYPCYATFDPKTKTWSERKKIEWDDPRATAMYTCGCGQRLILDNGDLLIPFSYAPLERADRAVGTVRCSFDGKTVSIQESGPELRLAVKRGLLEPSITRFEEKYWMTIRAEDGRGYVTVSKDGMHWETIQPWRWDDGEPLTMSTTQQHWIRHSQGLFLVYTRKAERNVNVMRWRAPLYIAQVDPTTRRLIRDSEKVVFPLIGDGVNDAKHVARMGNFHTTNVTPNQSWVTVGETLPEDGWKGDTLLGRIEWRVKNEAM